MKRFSALILVVLSVLFLSACKRDLNYIIDNKPSVKGIVESVSDELLIICCEESENYPAGTRFSVSLDVEYKDGITDYSAGDEVSVYYDGNITETEPLGIEHVYAVFLVTPADRSENEKS